MTAAFDPIYNNGTVSLTNGATTVTLVGGDFLTAAIRVGDQFKAQGLSVSVTAVTDATHIEVKAWPGTTISGGAYEILRITDAARMDDASYALMQLLVPNLAAVGGLTLAANKGIYATGASALALFDLTAAGRALLDDASADAQRQTISGLKNTRTVHKFTSSGTWTKPSGLAFAIVHVVGGGGGGGGAAVNNCGGGGGGGGYSCKFVTAASLGATETVTIGAPGAAGGSDADGSTGGTSSFGAHCSGAGGQGGTKGTNGGAGGLGGVGSSGDLNFSGNAGQCGTNTTSMAVRASGGGSVIGGGGKYNTAVAANSGGGGAGALNGANTKAGAAGYIWVEEFYL